MNCPLLRVSFGEAFDKLSILEIKLQSIQEERKRVYIQREIGEIKPKLESYDETCKDLYNELVTVNKKIWEMTDNMRAGIFVDSVDLMKANDQRFFIKSRINERCNSYIQEQKNFDK